MANTGTFNQARDAGQKNPSAKVATPQQIPNAKQREDHNAGLKHGQKKG
jgi:hypothetical protein